MSAVFVNFSWSADYFSIYMSYIFSKIVVMNRAINKPNAIY